jgi:hypothetical protein
MEHLNCKIQSVHVSKISGIPYFKIKTDIGMAIQVCTSANSPIVRLLDIKPNEHLDKYIGIEFEADGELEHFKINSESFENVKLTNLKLKDKQNNDSTRSS